MKEYTLLIDGNYFIYSRLYVLPKPKEFNLESKFMDSDREMGILMRKLCIDFASEIRKIKNLIKRIVFTLDSKSWRKDLFPNARYKANRDQDSKINWDNVNKIAKEFSELLQKQGVIVERVSGAEADDLIFGWVTYLNSLGESCIIWSGDSDLMQLVNYNKSTNSFCLLYDSVRSNLAVYPGFMSWLETKEFDKNQDIDIFTDKPRFYLIDQIKDEIKFFIEKNKLNIINVFCDEYIFKKILTGDKSDNISSVLELPSKKEGSKRINKINERKANSILDSFKKRHKRFSTIYLFDAAYKNEICQLISREMKVSGMKDEIKNKLELNIQLILLHVNTIPDAIQKIIFDKIKNDYDNENILEINNLLSKEKILMNTKYINENYNGNSNLTNGAIGLF